MKQVLSIFFTGLNVLLLSFQLPAQTMETFINIKGLLTDENGKPLRANIQVKNTRIGTSSNDAGEFSLQQVNITATLVITGIGLQTREVAVAGRSNLGSIKLAQAVTSTAEVVVTASSGYQSLKPNEVNGSIAVLDRQQLNRQAGTNILKRLDGAVSGLLFNTNKNNNNSQNKTGISVRGVSTIGGPLDPLIVLNGFIYEGNIENINPNDIENITVLKDAAAASVWGARAGNGVIVISTRKGGINQKLQVGFSSGFIMTDRPDLSSMPQVSSAEYVDMETFLFGKGWFNDRISFYPFYSLSPAVQVLYNRQRGLISAGDSASQLQALKSISSRKQYEQLVYRKGFIAQHSLQLSGGGKNNGYSFSAAYDNSVGSLREQYKKLNLRFSNSVQLLPKLRFDVESYFTNSEAVSGQRPYGEIKPAERYMMYYDITNPSGIETEYNTQHTDTLFGGRLLSLRYHPLQDYKYNKIATDLQEINANSGLHYSVKKWLKLDLRYQYQVQQSVGDRVVQREAYEARELINAVTQVNPNNSFKYIIPDAGIRTLTRAAIHSQTVRMQLNFNKNFGNHRLDAMAGGESREVKSKGDSYRTYGYNADPLTHTAVDFTGVYINPVTGFERGLPGAPSASKTLYRFASLYANASWLYKTRYSISASGRRDGSNIFGANTNDQWKPLWSAGAGWRISKEAFFKSKVVDDLRFKLTYGQSGNVDLSKTAVPIASIFGSDATNNLPFSRIRQLNNPYLKWEQVKQLNMGADFTLFKSRITGSIEWYSKHGTDLYGPVEWDYTAFGSSSTILQNVAHTKGRGVDLVLTTQNLKGRLGWNSNILLSYNKTITEKYYGPQANSQHFLLGAGGKLTPIVGRDVYGIMAYKWGGLDTAGNPQGYLNGQLSKDYSAMAGESITGSNLQYFGSGTPRFFGSLVNHFRFGKMELSISVIGKFNYYFIKPSLSYNSLVYGNAGNPEYSERWQKRGDELITNVPSFTYPNYPERDYFYSVSAVNVLKGDHIRLQYINFVYSLALKKAVGITSLQLYANAANLGILWRANTRGIDPDYPAIYSPPATWSFGVRANF